MKHTEQWIWLPESLYPENQKTILLGTDQNEADGHYTVAEFQRKYTFEKEIVEVHLRFSGDSAVQLFLNGKCVGTGPACVGGDFLDNDRPRDNFYAFETVIQPKAQELDFFARVQMMPVHICEYSLGRGGFMLSAVVCFADGTEERIKTDNSWQVRRNGAYTAPWQFDGRILPDECVQAEVIENLWNAETAPIPLRVEETILPKENPIALEPGEKKTVVLEFDKIWAGFVQVTAKVSGELRVHVQCRELDETGSAEDMIFKDVGEYRGFYMHSAGNLVVTAENTTSASAQLTVGLVSTHYPVYDEAETVTNDADLNLVLETCKHTLKICRQTHHLDSPRHCEPLACTGDYYIESLMTLFSFGDMRLAAFDVLRTAVMLERNDGRIFHTTYSLIWVRMLYDVYMANGDIALLEKCCKALQMLLARFERYVGENGLVDNPPDYMFVDWIYIDDISMHHPPKALGQTCLNMFYFSALEYAEKIFAALQETDEAAHCAEKKESLRCAVNSLLFDAEKQMYFEGLNTPTAEENLGKWMPQNVEKRYYLKHSNILAAYVGICEDAPARDLVDRIMSGEIEGDYQPYFAHYLLEAVYRLGMCEKYTLRILEQWKEPVKFCPKGLVEGFVKPEPTYSFDHSHAWGGTPLYALPKALMGLEILEPGMKTLRLSPSLIGLREAQTELLTPFGKVKCTLKAGEAPLLSCPEEIHVMM